MKIFVKRYSRHTKYSDYRIWLNQYGCKEFATEYPIDEAVILAYQCTDDMYIARAVFDDDTQLTESDVLSLYTGMGNIQTLVDALEKTPYPVTKYDIHGLTVK